ncbi:MAG: M48 family metallopeptidase [Cyanobacteria bacterium J06592_8]
MNFFEHQDQARQNTVYLIFLFAVAIICMIALLYGVTVWALMGKPTWEPELFAVVAVGTISCIGAGSVYKLIALRAGGKVVAEDLGGELIDPMTDNPSEQQLLNLVEEMSIASGIPVPPVYVLYDEQGINAFAAGFTPNDAVIGVTQGCIEQLNRDELQGVIAHEFSHILNGDMRLNLRLIGVLQGLLLIHILGRMMLRGSYYGGRSCSDKDDNSWWAIGWAMLALGWIGWVCGRLIKSAVSRQREFLADASAVQFTRNPDGIGNALQKIGGLASGSEIETPNAEEASHLFFGEASRGFFGSFEQAFSTHPPLTERIQRLQKFAGQTSLIQTQTPPSVSPSSTDERLSGFAGTSEPTPPKAQPSKGLSVSPERVVAGIGTTDLKHLNQVHKFLAELPEPVRKATRDPQLAIALIYSLLLDSDPQIGDQQLKLLQQLQSSEMVTQVQTFQPHLQSINPRTRLPLIDLTIPVLRQLSLQECTQFLKQVKALMRVDNNLTLSEYAVFIVLRQRLSAYFVKKPDQNVQFTDIKQIGSDCIILLSALAKTGHDSSDAIALAFRAGLFRLPKASGQTLPKEPVEYTLAQIGDSLKRLELATPKLKQKLVDACAYTVLSDQKVTLEEAELLRAIVISLNCPIPPFLA